MDAFGLVDKADENRIRELAHQYLTYLDDAVSVFLICSPKVVLRKFLIIFRGRIN